MLKGRLKEGGSLNGRLLDIARELVKVYGLSLLEDPERLGQLLEDKCGDLRHEIFVLSFALRELLKCGVAPSADAIRTDRARLEAQIVENLGFSRESAQGALDGIAYIFGGLSAEEAAGTHVEARRGVLRSIGAGMAKRPRTAPVRKKALRNGLLLLSIIMLFLFLYIRVTEYRYPVLGEHRVLFLAHLSGNHAASGHVRIKAAQLAADQVNARGGVKGRPLRILAQDMPETPDAAARAIHALVRERNATAMISACADDVNTALAEAADGLEIPLLASESSRMSVTLSRSERPWLYAFRTNYDNVYRGRLMAYFASRALKRKKIALISLNHDEDAAEVRSAFVEANEADEKYGGNIVCSVTYTKRGGIDQASLAEVLATDPELVVLVNPTSDVAALLQTLRRGGYKGTILGIAYDDHLLRGASEAADDSWWIVPASPEDSHLMSFQTSYRDKYNESIGPGDFAGTVLAYDSVLWMADALFRAPGFQGEALRHAFLSTKNLALTHATLSIDPRTHAPWQKATALIYCSGGRGRFQKRFRIQ